MICRLSLLLMTVILVGFVQADLLGDLSSPLVNRVRRQVDQGYGGGISMTVALNPYDRQNPINYADSVQFGYGVHGPGINQANTISSGNSIGNGKSGGSSFGGAGNNYGFGGGNANTLVAGSPGYGQANTFNTGFSGSFGNGRGQGGASGQVIPFGRRR